MKNVVCLVLGGGKGTRLLPLTADRSKPAVPLAGKYRLIDIPISNCISSGIRRIYLVTHAWHMRRSAMAFRNAGLTVIPAPMAFTTRYRNDVFAFVPTAGTLRDAYILTHELIGLLWYRIRLLVS